MLKLYEFAARRFRLHIDGVHGRDHWMRVLQNGLLIASIEDQADKNVLRAFAFLHDVERRDEGFDPGHGLRAGTLVARHADAVMGDGGEYLPGLDLTGDQLVLLERAIVGHADGRTTSCPTVGACWDADRLDLIRVGVRPDPGLMSTDVGAHIAKQMSRWE